jgi:GDP/UDP-N,N'-diacetylbacillosamine 2-epimerase (hydrolysing)
MVNGNCGIMLIKQEQTINNLKKICVVTGSRAEYGLLRYLLEGMQAISEFELQIVATGMHLSPEFGLTYQEIEKDGFTINKKVEMLLSSDTPQAISKSTGLGMIGFADAYIDLNPDLLIVLGDRYEILAASTVAMFAKIPIAHIHGGETTQGAYDEAIRHSITKMSWWHFVATEEYKNRVIQLGENPNRVFKVGGLGVDSIHRTKLLSKKDLIKKTGIKFGKKNLLITYHPETFGIETSKTNFQSLLDVLAELKEIRLIFTMPNSDTDGRIIKKMIDEFVSCNSERSISFTSMGHLKYLSTLQYVDGVVGNSSSGLTEVPSFKIGTINIGFRQEGRMKAESVIDCNPDQESIKKAIGILYNREFRGRLKTVKNPYGRGKATDKIMKILKSTKIPKQLKKEFYDL